MIKPSKKQREILLELFNDGPKVLYGKSAAVCRRNGWVATDSGWVSSITGSGLRELDRGLGPTPRDTEIGLILQRIKRIEDFLIKTFPTGYSDGQ
ncbi:MAG: hypothetical protein NXI13_13880 [Proteobacteria bacterium]|nr:hypothetical protein [Pseudomonadota bacterium]